MDSSEVIHKRILDKKWKNLEARGISRPKDEMESKQRLKEAEGTRKHGEVIHAR